MAGRVLALQVGTIAACLVLWEALARGLGGPTAVMPPVSAVLLDVAANHQVLLRGVLRTLTETVLGFAAGAAFGFLAGAAFAESRLLERLLLPLLVVSQTVPVIAFGALVVIWFGNGILSKMVIAFYLTFFPVTVNTLRGLLSVDRQRIDLMRSFGASPWCLFWRLRLPFALPAIMASLLLGVSLSLVGAIVGEWFGDTVGLGIMLVQAMYAENLPRLWSVVMACGVLGAGLYGILAAVERRFVWWGREL
ncbi:MAG: ABC transporter permease subunit [Alphaproteobacteria bacterium]|nr:ABC transporter permease subunit [Alphaproteobacteria bacterium]